jgi:phosphatidylserine decarboxylase
MTTADTIPNRARPEPLPDNIQSVQPGGGVCYRIELAWGRWRRWWLRHFRPGYVRRMAALRQGDCTGAPHDILDPRDLKFCRNVCGCSWPAEHDHFRWRGRLGLARWGLAEILLLGGPLLAIIVAAVLFLPPVARWCVVPLPAAALGLVVFFFRNPPRQSPAEPGLVLSPADATITDVTRLERDEFIGGPAVKIGMFLSIFNVHLNRAPLAGRVIALRYSPGAFLNAQRPESSLRNENMWIGLEEDAPPYRRLTVRQISGAIARRIVCDLKPGQSLRRGEAFGMIKLGSRTELILPAEGFAVEAVVGQRVRAGKSVLARYAS